MDLVQQFVFLSQNTFKQLILQGAEFLPSAAEVFSFATLMLSHSWAVGTLVCRDKMAVQFVVGERFCDLICS
jgi:hypothetical protein